MFVIELKSVAFLFENIAFIWSIALQTFFSVLKMEVSGFSVAFIGQHDSGFRRGRRRLRRLLSERMLSELGSTVSISAQTELLASFLKALNAFIEFFYFGFDDRLVVVISDFFLGRMQRTLILHKTDFLNHFVEFILLNTFMRKILSVNFFP